MEYEYIIIKRNTILVTENGESAPSPSPFPTITTLITQNLIMICVQYDKFVQKY